MSRMGHTCQTSPPIHVIPSSRHRQFRTKLYLNSCHIRQTPSPGFFKFSELVPNPPIHVKLFNFRTNFRILYLFHMIFYENPILSYENPIFRWILVDLVVIVVWWWCDSGMWCQSGLKVQAEEVIMKVGIVRIGGQTCRLTGLTDNRPSAGQVFGLTFQFL